MRILPAIAILFSLLCNYETKTLVIGSNLAVSLESSVQFPEIVLIGVNEILAFAWMKNGFSLENSDTELTFRSIYPVQGTVDLNGGTINLSTDLIFKNVTSLNGLGTVQGNGHIMRLSSSIASLPADTVSFEDISLFYENDLTINSSISFIGDSVINGNRHSLIFENSGEILISSNSSLRLQDLDLTGITGSAIRCEDNTATLVLDNVNWIQEATTIFDNGTLIIENEVEFNGTGTFCYESSCTSSIAQDSKWVFKDGIVAKIGRDPLTLQDPIAFANDTSQLMVDNADFITTDSGIQLTKGTIIFNRIVTFESIYTDTQRGIILGDGTAENDIHVRFNPGCTVIHNNGYWIYNNFDPEGFEANALSASIIRKEGSYNKIETDFTIPKLTLELASNYVPAVEFETDKIISYKESLVKLPDVEFEITSDQLSAYLYQLNGNDDIFFSKGSLPLALSIKNSGNAIRGNGNIDGPIVFEESAALSSALSGEIRNSVTLNNGSFTLLGLAKFDNLGQFIGPGYIDLSQYNLQLSPSLSQLTTPLEWHGTSAILELTSKLSLLETWTFSGSIILEGNGNSLTLDDLGKIYLKPGADLTLKDITLVGVADDSVMVQDDTSKITFVDAHLIFDGHYTHSLAQLAFERKNSFSGTYTICLEQEATSTIKINSELSIQDGATLSVGRGVINNFEPFYFEDSSSKLHMNNANLLIQSTGAAFTRGIVECDKEVQFSFNSTHTGNGMQIGDGTQAGDVIFQFNPGSKIYFNPGHVLENLYDNENGLVGLSTSVELHLGAGLTLHYMNDGLWKNLSVVLSPPAPLAFDPGASIHIRNVRTVLPQGTALATIRGHDNQSFALEGDDTVELLAGMYPLPMYISGSNNSLTGVGGMSGPVFLEDENSSLIVGVTGLYDNVIQLNGGSVVLSSAVNLGNGIAWTGPGLINVGSHFIKVGGKKTSWTSSLEWLAGDGGIAMNAHVDLLATWTISGDMVLKGNSYSLNLNQQGQLRIGENSSLQLENIKLRGIGYDQIIFEHDSSRLILKDVTCEFDDAFTMTQGSIFFEGDNRFKGIGNVFAYESSQTSTICIESSLQIDSHMTFSYYPQSEQNNLLEMEDETARLAFDGGILRCGRGGLKLTKGHLHSSCNSKYYFETYLDENGQLVNNGLTLGDDDESLDCIFFIESGSEFSLLQGALNYRNVKSTSLTFEGDSSIFSILQDVALRLYQDFSFSKGRVELERGGKIERYNDKRLIGPIFMK